eukprot:TRINITY_DN114616_c0_g1_i4.p1 TRINITY_DN114616_c0_g1~~TRINITY_DN114616_c0_g1_i4.p1  ORF type:complete len:158 (+),score=13.65 TRINITY_DN114616_c0_g1_i4:115-588(+)
MPRRSSGGSRSVSPRRADSSKSSGGWFSPSKAAPATKQTAPVKTQSQAPVVAPQQGGGGLLGNIGSSIVGGMASGVGFSVANRAVDSVLGPREVVHRHEDAPQDEKLGSSAPVMQQSAEQCQSYMEQLNQCLSQSSDISSCQFYHDALKQCRGQAFA